MTSWSGFNGFVQTLWIVQNLSDPISLFRFPGSFAAEIV